MNPTNRRAFLTLAGAGVATAGLAAVATSAHAAPAAAAAAAPAAPAAPANHAPVVAHVVDAKAGVVTVMVAGRSLTVTDKALAAQLGNLAARATASA